MAWNEIELRTLVERFWDGETSVFEEDQLREALQREDLPEEFEGVAAYFESLKEPAELGNSFDDALFTAMGDEQSKGKVRSMTPKWFLAAAAILVMLLSGYWFFQQDAKLVAQEEYSKEEIEQAWEQTQVALKKIGVEINEAQVKTQKISKFNQAKMAIQYGNE